MKRRILSLLLLMLAVSLAACVGGQRNYSSGGGQGETLSQQVARHDQQIQGILSQVGQVEQVLPGQAEMWSQMQTMRQEVNTMHGQIDDLNNQLSASGSGEVGRLNKRVNRMETLLRKIASQLAISTDNLDEPLPSSSSAAGSSVAAEGTAEGAGAAAVGTAATGTSATGAATGTPPAAATGSVDTANALYDAGIKNFDQKKYKDAIVSFKDFGTNFPKHKLAGNAHFWEGESYFQLKDYPRAALAYQEVITKYPGSPKLPAAMLKQGISLHNANKKDAAKERLQELVKKYPNSPEATRAKQFMQTNK